MAERGACLLDLLGEILESRMSFGAALQIEQPDQQNRGTKGREREVYRTAAADRNRVGEAVTSPPVEGDIDADDIFIVVTIDLREDCAKLVDLTPLFPRSQLDPQGQILLSEIDADAVVHSGGGLAPLTPEAWLAKWQELRKCYPDYEGHRMGHRGEGSPLRKDH